MVGDCKIGRPTFLGEASISAIFASILRIASWRDLSAQDLGEIDSSKDIKALSRYFASSTHGLLVTGKSNASKEEMQDIVNVIFESLK